MAPPANPRRGRFITFEGGEGAGKSTQIQRLAATLVAAGIPVLVTREPGGSPGAEEIRALLVTGEPGRWQKISETLLHFAARAEHLAHKVLPALDAGTWVLCDRFADSTMAYQGYGHQLGRAPVLALNRLVLRRLKPDLTLILDLPVKAGLARAAGRGGADRYERMGKEFHERVRRGFRDIARREARRCRLLSADGPVDAVAARVRQAVAERFRLVLR
ncbi:MAG: dTMP kinase [Alphaproteobacteria bacterium]|nr:dTMP kinase [Alphaproteobacteria bacterium]